MKIIKAAKKLKKLEKQLVEVRANKAKRQNKLKSMVEFLAMDEKDVLQLMAIFKKWMKTIVEKSV